MKKTVLLYGLLGGVLIATLKVVEYRFLVLQHSFEIYGGIVALLFAGLGIWLGLRITKTHETVVIKEVPVPVAGPFQRNEAGLAQLGITPRELEILEAMAAGLSNREIAETLFVSEMPATETRMHGDLFLFPNSRVHALHSAILSLQRSSSVFP